jgi:hypothetical protein
VGEWFPSLFHLPIIPFDAVSFPGLLVCVSQAGLELVSAVREPPVFSVSHGVEKLCMGWGFGVSEFCFFLVFFFCQVWLQHLSKIFDLQSSCCLLPPSITILDPLRLKINKLMYN